MIKAKRNAYSAEDIMATVFHFMDLFETQKNYDRMFPFDSVRTLGFKHDVAWHIASMIPGCHSNYEFLEYIYTRVCEGWDVSSSEVVSAIYEVLVLRGDLIEESAMWLHEHRFILECGSESLRL